MKEIENKDLPEVGGGLWHDDGCVPSPDPLKEPSEPLLLTPELINPAN